MKVIKNINFLVTFILLEIMLLLALIDLKLFYTSYFCYSYPHINSELWGITIS